MESASSYIQNLLSGYRFPDVSKLWRKTDCAIDGRESTKPPQVPILVQLEAYLVRLQELALWIDPKSSVAALVAVHLVFMYLSLTSNTVLNLTCWAAAMGYLYTTWVYKIWPEIRVEKPPEEAPWTPVRPEVFSAPELVHYTQAAQNKLESTLAWLRDLRSKSKGLFCLGSCVVFSVIGYLGAYVTTLGLLYYVLIIFMTIPALVRAIILNQPSIQAKIEEFRSGNGNSLQAIDRTDSPSTEIEQSRLTNVCSKVQAQLSSMVSHLNVVSASKTDDEDDLKEYLPEVNDEQTKQILEEGALANPQSPTQGEEWSLEYSSLLSGLGQSMPDIEEDEVEGRRLYPALPMSQPDEAEDDFLPAVDPRRSQLLLDELDEEEENSSLYFSSALVSNAQVGHFSGFEDPDDHEKEDFEFISEEELTEAMKK